MKAIAIIGANFGDEGKGRMVDHFAHNLNSNIVVRYNAGAQAGHTVVTPEGVRMIFHHFGSGTAVGSPTYLSEFFIVNPMLFMTEHIALEAHGITPIVYVHPLAPVSTPYDMLINREVERFRGDENHGSCGYGIGETVERLCNSPHRLFVKDIGTTKFVETVMAIRDDYVPERLKQLSIATISDAMRSALKSSQLIEGYLESVIQFTEHLSSVEDKVLSQWGSVIFEGSQGLCLDERHPFFPHVTRSKTGLTNIASICKRAGITNIEAVYVTRAYMTRHGVGPFPTEDKNLSFVDLTNTENEWQGELRFGCLDLDLMKQSVTTDIERCPKELAVSVSLAITCLDQVGDSLKIKYQNKFNVISPNDLPGIITDCISAQSVYLSKSSSRK